jgi:hypothetical protein
MSILDENLLSLAGAAAEIRAHEATARRLILNGVLLPGGGRLKLEAVRIGGRWKTSKQAIERFVASLTAARQGDQDVPVPVAPTPRHERDLAQVDTRLNELL